VLSMIVVELLVDDGAARNASLPVSSERTTASVPLLKMPPPSSVVVPFDTSESVIVSVPSLRMLPPAVLPLLPCVTVIRFSFSVTANFTSKMRSSPSMFVTTVPPAGSR